MAQDIGPANVNVRAVSVKCDYGKQSCSGWQFKEQREYLKDTQTNETQLVHL